MHAYGSLKYHIRHDNEIGLTNSIDFEISGGQLLCHVVIATCMMN